MIGGLISLRVRDETLRVCLAGDGVELCSKSTLINEGRVARVGFFAVGQDAWSNGLVLDL